MNHGAFMHYNSLYFWNGDISIIVHNHVYAQDTSHVFLEKNSQVHRKRKATSVQIKACKKYPLKQYILYCIEFVLSIHVANHFSSTLGEEVRYTEQCFRQHPLRHRCRHHFPILEYVFK